ncbi:glycosyltransferase family protein [Selenomonas sp. F0473]|uniref:glycosyltransferase family protein n=1 Tax=Selenomonas sp. F0473 TaxID=999423 RepID=UPI0025FCAF25|nr:glycosyltransferase [Selenomonas sp. F0473]
MNVLRIVVAATEEGAYLDATLAAACAACTESGIGAEIVAAAPPAAAKRYRKTAANVALLTTETESLARLYNAGAADAAAPYILFLREGVLIRAEGLRTLLDTICMAPEIGAVGPFGNRTAYAWQYLNAARMEADGLTAGTWLRETVGAPTQSLFLENFALLVRRECFVQTGGFSEDFPAAGGEDIDLSLRLKCMGRILLRVPVYFPHAGAEVCDLYDMARLSARAVLLERWGLDVGVPETLWHTALMDIEERLDPALIAATCRSARLRAPLVSLMMRVPDDEERFFEMLGEACAQLYPNVEIVACAADTEPLTERLPEAYRRDPSLRCVRVSGAQAEETYGALFARLAQGRYVGWCRADEILLPDKLTLMVDAFLQHPEIALATSMAARLAPDGRCTIPARRMPPIYGDSEVVDGTAAGRSILMECDNFIGAAGAVLVRREDLIPLHLADKSPADACAAWLSLLERGGCAVFRRPLCIERQESAEEEPEELVRRCIAWRRLIAAYWSRRVFITETADHDRALVRLREVHAERAEALLLQVDADVRRMYETDEEPLSVVVMDRIAACAHVRLDTPLGAMRALGALTLSGCTRDDITPLTLDTFIKRRNSIILMERRIIPDTASNVELFARTAVRGNLILHEIDDRPEDGTVLSASDYFAFRAVSAMQTSTPVLADYLREFNPHVVLMENQLAALPEKRTYAHGGGDVTVFFGALNRGADWAPLMDALNETIRVHEDRLFFLVTGDRAFYETLRTRRKQFVWGKRDGDPVASYADYTAALHASDIALLPLGDTAFNRAKSDLKFIESAGHGAVALASPTVYERTVRDGETGMIYRNVREFSRKLSLLITRPDLRTAIAENAYRYVAEHRLIGGHVDTYIAAYRDLFARREELERARRARVEKYFPQLVQCAREP